MKIVPIILSGGAGTRLWPVSRELHPKPFIQLSDGQSLLQKSFLRARGISKVEEILTVTNRDLYFKTLDEYRSTGQTNCRLGFILEPEGKNTAPAIAAAALACVVRYEPETILLVQTADHLIADLTAFNQAVEQAIELAMSGSIVTFGIQPTEANTGYGYIEASGHHVMRFVEKPDAATAQTYLDCGRYLWNSGMFCAKLETLLSELRQYAPNLMSIVEESLTQSVCIEGTQEYRIELDPKRFSAVDNISIDYALMEKTKRAAIVPCSIGWSDIGSWSALGDLAKTDLNGNNTQGDVFIHDVQNCYLRSEDRIVAAVGIRDLIVVDTPDALLVAEKSHAQDVKQIVAQLKSAGHESYKLHRTVHRPWGTYTILEEGLHFKIKRIVVKPGASLSLQMHHHRSEHWIVVEGMAQVVNGEKELIIVTNESTFIPAGHKHRLENPGKIDLVLIEVQSGQYLGEDDIVRFQDNYGRI
ncbi:mannose-1-phosphate guanylyltransferase/mannose-6-phosphate isomerase [Zwartia vadi]|uniref:mannose-1-phosphate guanylyltransferase/mannose-6-phosphate isomerase n=1 Tax=Zwartia vadi TaxID=3058168 RepID=UPI0025B58358|nr:mannose-1-phosphate guanylyltransferase/mannose-6-phosphate isomerase [Zwartia vadi]MDN3988220.1 mannose-1-phosphate guanylyltransferase/mannose-6-phosphate isomerase [Zwartia vadi]